MIRAELPPPEHDADEVRRVIDEVLARSEFDRPPPTLTERVEDAFSELIGRVFTSLIGSGAGSALAWLVMAVAIGFVVFFVARYGRTVQADRAVRDRPEMVELSRSPAEWRSEAERSEAEGRWKDGMLARYRALVGYLVVDGVLDEIPGRTSGEYRDELAERRPEWSEPFSEATALFERAWYGDAPTGPEERDRMIAADLGISGARR